MGEPVEQDLDRRAPVEGLELLADGANIVDRGRRLVARRGGAPQPVGQPNADDASAPRRGVIRAPRNRPLAKPAAAAPAATAARARHAAEATVSPPASPSRDAMGSVARRRWIESSSPSHAVVEDLADALGLVAGALEVLGDLLRGLRELRGRIADGLVIAFGSISGRSFERGRGRPRTLFRARLLTPIRRRSAAAAPTATAGPLALSPPLDRLTMPPAGRRARVVARAPFEAARLGELGFADLPERFLRFALDRPKRPAASSSASRYCSRPLRAVLACA